jgi:hypothetical protein
LVARCVDVHGGPPPNGSRARVGPLSAVLPRSVLAVLHHPVRTLYWGVLRA